MQLTVILHALSKTTVCHVNGMRIYEIKLKQECLSKQSITQPAKITLFSWWFVWYTLSCMLCLAGLESSLTEPFPETFLYSGNFEYTDHNGNLLCNDTTDTVNMCTDSTKMTVSTDNGTCSQNVAYSGRSFIYLTYDSRWRGLSQ